MQDYAIFGVLVSSYYDLVCSIPFLKKIIDTYYLIFGGVKNGVIFGFIYLTIGAVIAKKYTTDKLNYNFIWPKTIIAFGLVCAEALLCYVFGWATHGVDLKFTLVPFAYYFIVLILSLENKYGNSEFFVKKTSIWKHLRDLSILIFLLQRIPLTILENWHINSILYTIVIFGITLILSEILILISKKFKKIKLY